MRVRLLLLLAAACLMHASVLPPLGAAPVPSLARAPGQKSPTNVLPLRLSVVFSEPVLGLQPADVVLSCNATVDVREVVPNDGTTFEIEISSVLEDGLLCASIPAGAAVGLDGSPSLPSTGTDSCILLDRVPPALPELLEPGDGAATPDLSPSLVWAAPLNEADPVKYRVEIRGPKTRNYVTTRTTYTPTLGLQGSYTWHVNCTDGAGNVGPWTPWRSLVLDSVPPEPPAVTSTSPAGSLWVQAMRINITFSGASDSLSGLAGYTVLWDHDPSSTPSGAANRPASWDEESLASPEDGEWWFHAVAMDCAGNRSTSCHVGPFRVDRTPPALVGGSDSLTLPNDPGRLFATVNWSFVKVVDALDPHPTISCSIPNGTVLPIGSSSAVITACDHAGNKLTRNVRLRIVNTEPPTITVKWPEENEKVLLGEIRQPAWSVSSLAPIASVTKRGLDGDSLDTRVPGKYEFSVAVSDTTGLRTAISVPYVVLYAERGLEIAWIAADALEEIVWPPPPGSTETAMVTFHSSESMRIRCRPDLSPEAAKRQLPITFSLARMSRSARKPPTLERAGLLDCVEADYKKEIPLAGLKSGNYTLWIGFIDGFTQEFKFRLVY